ncbi:MAG: hypothetical protein JSW08_01980, partial [archaeon]
GTLAGYNNNSTSFNLTDNAISGDLGEIVITLTSAGADNAPNWSANSTDIVTDYNPTTQSYFNITWEDDNSVSIVYIEANWSGSPANETMNNITAIIYNYSLILGAGGYYWESYANDSTNQWNNSDQWEFTISQNTSNCQVLFNETSPLTHPDGFLVYTDCTTAYTLYRNGTEIANNSEQDLIAGTYNFSVLRTDQSNYSNTYDEENFVINQNSGNCQVLFNETSPNVYPNGFRSYTDCTTTYTLRRNGTTISNNSEQDLTVGVYNFSVQRTDNENYSNIYDEENFEITIATTALSLGASPSWNEDYGTETTVTGSNCPAQITCNLYRDDVGVSNPETETLGVGTHTYIYNTSGNENYTSDSETNNLIISQASPSVTLYLNGTQNNRSYLVPNAVNASARKNTGSEGTLELLLNGSVVNTTTGDYGENITSYASEDYINYTARFNATVNYSAQSVTYFANMTTTPPVVTNCILDVGWLEESETPYVLIGECEYG